MEPRREERKTPTPNPGESKKLEEPTAPAVTLVRPFRIELLEERIAPASFLKAE
jgi:hypothetical protein